MTIIIPPRTESAEPTFCTECGIYLALPPHRLLCPVCIDKAARDLRGQS